MARYTITISSKGIRRDTIDRMAHDFNAKYGEKGASITVKDTSPPTSRPHRLEAIQNAISEIKGDVDELRDEIQEWLDNLPENLQSSSKADDLQECIENLDEIGDNLDNAASGEVSFPNAFG